MSVSKPSMLPTKTVVLGNVGVPKFTEQDYRMHSMWKSRSYDVFSQ